MFGLHGLHIAVHADAPLREALAERLVGLDPCQGNADDLRFEYGADAVHEGGADARPIYESAMGSVSYAPTLDALFLTSVWPIRACTRAAEGRTLVRIEGAQSDYLWPLAHPVFTLPLLEKLKRRGRYSVHAAALAWRGQGLLLAGASGSGKSTLALALVRAGFGFQGDDMVFLRTGDQGIVAQSFAESFDLTEASLGFFPELEGALRAPRRPGWPKHQLDVRAQYGAELARETKPRLIVFPRVVGGGASVLSPMPRSEALLELVPNILLTEPVSSQRHLDALRGLVEQCACYRLETGRDFDHLALRLRTLLEEQP